MTETQEQLPLEDHRTILFSTPEPEGDGDNCEYESPFQRVWRIMKEERDE